MSNAEFRLNLYNKQNQTVSCKIGNDMVCKANIIVITEEGTENCTIPIANQATDRLSTNIQKTIKSEENGRLDCKLNTDVIEARSGFHSFEQFRPVLRLVL